MNMSAALADTLLHRLRLAGPPIGSALYCRGWRHLSRNGTGNFATNHHE